MTIVLNKSTLLPEQDYLCIEGFLKDFSCVQFLNAAFEIGIIDALEQQENQRGSLLKLSKTDSKGLNFIIAMLVQAGIVNDKNNLISLTDSFRHALQYRDLIEAKIYFANLLAPDLMSNASSFIRDADEFMQKSRLFELFDYNKAIEINSDNIQHTKHWMKLTSTLTHYESASCLAAHDYSAYSNIMDIGGNSGEFCLQICRLHPQISATVIDLPVVCEVGKQHVSHAAQAKQIEFIAADALIHSLPTGKCLVSFKSILHDWPIEACQRFIEQAYNSLNIGGTLLIFERLQIDLELGTPDFCNLPTFLFFRSYRPAEAYYKPILEQGFIDLELKIINLETPFLLITARKPSY